jgi:hypothetical protein
MMENDFLKGIKLQSEFNLELAKLEYSAVQSEFNMWQDCFNNSQKIDVNDTSTNYFLFSPGGAGTVATKEHYSTFLDYHPFHYTGVGNRQGHGTHISKPEHMHVKDFRGVYLVSHPIDTVISFYKRGFFTNIEHVINVGGHVTAALDFALNALEHKDKRYSTPTAENMNVFLDYYTDYRIDFFDLANHIKNWSEDKRLMVVKYTDIPAKEKDIRNLYQVPSTHPKFPWKKRSDSKKLLSPRVLKKLQSVYQHAIEEYEKLP